MGPVFLGPDTSIRQVFAGGISARWSHPSPPDVHYRGESEHDADARRYLLMTDAVEKVFLYHRAQVLRAIGTPVGKLFGGIHHPAVTHR
jgi:hypothetical protein